jgi:hypothetical protein
VAGKTQAAAVPPTPRDDAPWDVRILELIDLGIDGTLIEENLRRTPTQRLARMQQQMLSFLERASQEPWSRVRIKPR